MLYHGELFMSIPVGTRIVDWRRRSAKAGRWVLKPPTRLLPESEERRNHSEIARDQLGSEPRGRRFKPSRPDQFKNIGKGDPS